MVADVSTGIRLLELVSLFLPVLFLLLQYTQRIEHEGMTEMQMASLSLGIFLGILFLGLAGILISFHIQLQLTTEPLATAVTLITLALISLTGFSYLALRSYISKYEISLLRISLPESLYKWLKNRSETEAGEDPSKKSSKETMEEEK